MPLDMKERSSVWCPESVCDSFPTGPVGSLFLLVFNATSTSFIKPGQLKVPGRQQMSIIWHLTVLKSSYMLIRRYFKKKKRLLLWRQIGQRPTKCHYWQKGCYHDGLHCTRGRELSYKKKILHFFVHEYNILSNESQGHTILHIRIKRRQFWFALRNICLFLLHALLQSLKHTLFTYSLNVPSTK